MVITVIDKEMDMIHYVTCSIWGVGPGRPHDNGYQLTNMEIQKDAICLRFDGDEKCVVFSPHEIQLKDHLFIVKNAAAITWDFYYYGKPKNSDFFVHDEYIFRIDNTIQLTSSGAINKREILKQKSLNAFELIGNMEVFRKRYENNMPLVD